MNQAAINRAANVRKLAQLCQREVRRVGAIASKRNRDILAKAKRISRDVLAFWKRNEKEERELKRKAEKEEMERRKMEEELREARRQQRKLNFLITQTELYSHFLAKKLGAAGDTAPPPSAASASTAVPAPAAQVDVRTLDFDAVDDAQLAEMARRQALEGTQAEARVRQDARRGA